MTRFDRPTLPLENVPAGNGRIAIFFLSPRVIDFDTYLPTAMQLKEARPDWDLRFVTFNPKNYDFVAQNETLLAGLARCGQFYYVGSADCRGRLARIVRRTRSFGRITAWILRRPRPILFLSRPFSEFPYSVWYAFARLRGGRAYLLWKLRSPDAINRLVYRNRQPPQPRPLPWLARLRNGDQDAIIYYHDRQHEMLEASAVYGRIYNVPWYRIGLPHRFPAWRRLIEEHTALARKHLVQDGVPADAELYCLFPPKPFSGVNVGTPGSMERGFEKVMTALARLRPNAYILLRPHPLALDEPYIQSTVEKVGRERVRISFFHPEVLLILARRSIFNNPSNLLFSCFDARIIDCTEYPDYHYSEAGRVSLAHGYGVVYVDTTAPDFEAHFARALEDDSLFETSEAASERNALIRDNPTDLALLLAVLDGERGVLASNRRVQREASRQAEFVEKRE